VERVGVGEGFCGVGARQVGGLHLVLLHFLGQGDDDRAGATAGGDIDGVGNDLGDAFGVVDLGDPFGEGCEHLAVIDFLEGVATGVLVRDLADEQQHRRAVLVGDVDADGAMAGAGATGDHRGGGAAGEFAECVGHVDRAGLEPAGDELDFALVVVEAVEGVEEAFAGNLEDVVDALGDEGVGKDAAAVACCGGAGLAGLGEFHWVRSPVSRKDRRVGGTRHGGVAFVR